MNVNNQCYKMFKQMKEGYTNNNKSDIEQCARCLLDLASENPFQEGTDEYEAFFQMQKCYHIWRNGDIDQKINKRRMLQWAIKLCALDPRNPYKFDKKAEEEELKQQYFAQIEPVVTEKIILDEPKKVLGVPPEEKKSWLRFLFPWRKESE